MAESVYAVPNEIPTHRRISIDCWNLLNHLRRNGWRANAHELNALGSLNYRARISDLRRQFGLDIIPDPPHPPPGTAATYYVPLHAQPRATWLLERLSLSGYQERPQQTALFSAPTPQEGARV